VSECGIAVSDRASGLFAPGHLGALTSLVPTELVDAVLAATGRTQRRLRMLPSRVGVYLVLAMVLFPQVGLAGVWVRLTAGLAQVVVSPSEKALRDLRRRVGPEPLAALFATVAGPLGWPGQPGVRYRSWRTVAFDGCSSWKLPDTDRNRARFGRVRQPAGVAAYPALMLMALVETGTRGLIGAVFGPTSTGEFAWARQLLPMLAPDMLVLADRGFDARKFLSQISGTGAEFLVRARVTRILPATELLLDGSYLTRLGGMTLRVITARIEVACADGTVTTTEYRLLTTLTDHRTDPAQDLVLLYHERWEIETAFLALRHTLAGRTVLRSGDPVGIAQEMWALLTIYQVLRTAMTDAAATAGADPDRTGFTTALHAARDSLILAEPAETSLSGRIGTQVLAAMLPPRRPRTSPRAIKAATPRYRARHRGEQHRTGTPITTIDINIIPTDLPPTPPALDAAIVLTDLPPLHPTTRPDVLQALAIIHTHPDRTHRCATLGRLLGLTTRRELNAFGVALRKQARLGRINKTGTGTYTATTTPLTPPPNP